MSRLGPLGPNATPNDELAITTQHQVNSATNGPIVQDVPVGIPEEFDPNSLTLPNNFINAGEVHVAIQNIQQTNVTKNEDNRTYTTQFYQDQRKIEAAQQVLNVGMDPELHSCNSNNETHGSENTTRLLLQEKLLQVRPKDYTWRSYDDKQKSSNDVKGMQNVDTMR